MPNTIYDHEGLSVILDDDAAYFYSDGVLELEMTENELAGIVRAYMKEAE